jgi:hypothetical protein
MLVKDQKKFNFWRRAGIEISYAFFLGSVPVLLCSTAVELIDMVKTLLTFPALMAYYAGIWGVFAITSLAIFFGRSRSSNYHYLMRHLHAFFANVGGSLLVALRAAAGGMFGYLLVRGYQSPETMTLASVVPTGSYASMTLIICVMLAQMDKALTNPHAMSRYS